MFCKNCGTQLKDGVKFCPRCGTPVANPRQNSDAMGTGPDSQQQSWQQGQWNQASQQNQEFQQGQGPQQNWEFQQGQGPQQNQEFQWNQTSQQNWEFQQGQAPQQNQGFYQGQSPYQGQPFYQSQAPQPEPEALKTKKRSKKVVIIPVVCVAAAAVIGVGVFAMTRTNFFKSRFSSPASYYADVEQAAMNKAAEQAERSQAYLNQLTGFKANLTIEDAGLALFGFSEYDLTDALDGLSELELSGSRGTSDNLWGSQIILSSGDISLMTLNAVIDENNGDMYIKIPELSPDYLVWASEDFKSAYGINPQTALSPMEFWETFQLSPMISRYGEILLKYSDDVSRENSVVTVNEVEQDAICLTVTYDSQSLEDMARECMEAMRTDPQLKELLLWSGTYAYEVNGYGTAEDYYNEFIASLDDSLENMEAIPSEVYATMNVWVDSDGEIIGRTLDVTQNGENMQVFSFLTAVDNGNFGASMMLFPDSGSNLTLNGSGTVDGGKVNGNFILIGTNASPYAINVSDFDTDQLENGYINGRFVISQNGGNMALDCASDEDAMDISISSLSSDVPVWSLNLSLNQEKYTPILPEGQYAYRIADADALEEYAANLDVDGFMSGLMQNAFLKYVLEASGYVY